MSYNDINWDWSYCSPPDNDPLYCRVCGDEIVGEDFIAETETCDEECRCKRGRYEAFYCPTCAVMCSHCGRKIMLADESPCQCVSCEEMRGLDTMCVECCRVVSEAAAA